MRPHRKFRGLEGGTGGKRHDIDKLVAHLAIDQEAAANVSEKDANFE